jgi:transposase
MSTAVAAILDGMPEPSQLRCTQADGQVVVTVGATVLFCFERSDVGMRNVAVATLRSLGFAGQVVAAAFGLSEQYVATLNQRATRQGSAGLVRASGRPGKLSGADWGRAVSWRDQGVSNVEIGRRLGVHNSTISRALRDAASSAATDEPAVDELAADQPSAPWVQPEAVPEPAPAPVPAPEPVVGSAPATVAAARIGEGVFTSRYAGAMLLHAFADRVRAEATFNQVANPLPRQRFDDVAVLAATSVVFALGFSSLEQAKHPDRAQVGPTVGIGTLPELRTLRPRLATIADRCDPLGLQRSFATAMLAADPNTSGVYFVDDHFVPYAGALPVDKGWNTKRRHAEPGRADTMICDAAGRAICFTTGEPAGLASTLGGVLAQLRQVGDQAPIMLGFDRGGAYPSAFRTCRAANVHWITYRRAPLADPTGLAVTATLRRGEQTHTIAYTDEQVTINGYGTARQLSLFEGGQPVLQILTSDPQACAGALIWFMRARWRIENLFKYLDFYGLDWLADYHATLHTNTRKIDNPARKQANTQLKALTTELATLQQHVGELAGDRTLSVAATNKAIATTQAKITKLEKRIEKAKAERDTHPAKLPANQINPAAKRAVHRAHRRALQTVLRLLAHNAEHWLAHRLNAYLQDPNEYRATTRNLMHLGGTITYTPQTITVHLDQPTTPRLTAALDLLLQEINNTPPRIPGDPRPITYTLNT